MFLENPQNGWSFFDIFRSTVWWLELGALNEGGGSVLFLFYFIYYFIFSSVSPSLAKGCNVISELSWSIIRIHIYIYISLSYFLPVAEAEAAGFKPLSLGSWVNRSTNETARFKNVNNHWNANISSFLEISGRQSSNLYLNVIHFINASVNETSVTPQDSCFSALVSIMCSFIVWIPTFTSI